MGGLGNAENRHLKLVRTRVEQRKHLRTRCERVTFFATHDRLYEGYVKNISLGGVYIQARDVFAPGEKITVAIPCQSNPDGVKLKAPYADEEIKMKCVVIWKDPSGFGSRFIQSS